MLVVSLPVWIWLDVRRAIDVVEPIDGAALVAMQPGAVSAKGDQVSKRGIGIIPHKLQICGMTRMLSMDESMRCNPGACQDSCSVQNPPATAGGTDLMTLSWAMRQDPPATAGGTDLMTRC